MTLSVLLFGATGYLGGTLLTDLERASEYEVTCAVRPEKKACMADRKTKLLLVRAPLLALDGPLTARVLADMLPFPPG